MCMKHTTISQEISKENHTLFLQSAGSCKKNYTLLAISKTFLTHMSMIFNLGWYHYQVEQPPHHHHGMRVGFGIFLLPGQHPTG